LTESGFLTTLRILNDLKRRGVIVDYAIYGAMAVMRYTEAVSTQDLDIVLIQPETKSPVVLLTPVFSEFRRLGYRLRGEHVIVEGLPVQFVTADALEREAINKAKVISVGRVTTKVLTPEYLLALAARAGRAKDKAKIALLLEQATVDQSVLEDILQRHGLKRRFEGIAGWLRG